MPETKKENDLITPLRVKHTMADRKQQRLLLVDDDLPVLEVERRMLSSAGYSVSSVNDPNDALRLLEDQEEQIDLLVTDVAMPEMTGPDLLRKVLPQRSDLKFLFVSGGFSKAQFRRGDPCLMKPVEREQLISTIQHLLASKPDITRTEKPSISRINWVGPERRAIQDPD